MPSVAIVTGTFPPRHRDGTGLTFAALAERLAAMGWAVNVLVTKGKPGDGTGTSAAAAGEVAVLTGISTLSDVVAEVARRAVDVVVTSKNAGYSTQLGSLLAPRPVVIYFQGVTQIHPAPDLPASVHVAFASDYLRSIYLAPMGRDGPVLRPIVDGAAFSAVRSRRRHVLTVGLGRVKRPDIVFAVARQLPQLTFDLYQSWGDLLRWRNWPLLTLRNVKLHRAVSDPARLFGDARVAMVASDSEGWCRVVTEGHLVGVPTIARRRAALPESVGSGGVLLPAEADIAEWVAALRAVFEDAAHYEALVARARAESRRPELAPEQIFSGWVKLLTDKVEG